MFNVSKYSTKPMLVKQSGSPLLADHHQFSNAWKVLTDVPSIWKPTSTFAKRSRFPSWSIFCICKTNISYKWLAWIM